MAALEDRFVGAFLGQCVGDAVGFMVEGSSPAACRAYADQVLIRGEAFEGRRGPYRLGQYSDDSQLARELMRSYVTCRRFDPAEYAARIANMFAAGRVVGGGRATREAAARLSAGVPWTEAGAPPPNAGNGSAMRAGPIGLMFYDDPEALVAAACDQGRITHADPRCSAGAVAIAGAVALALALAETRIDVNRFVEQLASMCRSVDGTVAETIAGLGDIVDLAPEDAVAAITAAARPDYQDVASGISPFVTTSVAWSLYAFLRNLEDYTRAIHTAVAVGGDVDTTAAMTGTIAGARHGSAALPQSLVARLTDRGAWGAPELTVLARQSWHVRCSG